MNSCAMSYLLSIATVIIFTGLTAYDVHKQKALIKIVSAFFYYLFFGGYGLCASI
jgi:FtsH-binding integral membrane protein